ncbi:MAG: PDZ domain-containing protein [Verrucomicrobia bacterium]|nr:PDZ domain-containing protein [Verrucomicrobiota bacterium]
MRLLATAAAFALLLPTLSPAAPVTAATAPKRDRTADASVVRVTSTNQQTDLIRPWTRKAPFTRRGLGAVLPKNRVLITAELIQNYSHVELEKAESGERMEAKVLCVDYEANLALLEPAEPKYLAGMKPLDVVTDAVAGDTLRILQLESNDAVVSTPGPVTTVEVARYQIDDASFLLYRLSLSLPVKESSFTAPVLKENRLAGMLLRYSPQSQTADVIPGPVVAHFLKDFEDGEYRGFPRAGFQFASTRDPQLRQYANMPAGNGGVYVTDVVEGMPADKAGLKVGDVLLALGDAQIDQDGNYNEPLYGRITVSHILSTKNQAGDKLAFKILREGKPMTLEVTLEKKAARDYAVPPYIFETLPNYVIAGGLIFQELTRSHLKEWGNEWRRAAPQRLVLYDQQQTQLIKPPRKRVVFLSQVLPTAATVGYNELAFLVVTKVNGQPINELADLPKALEKPVDGFHKIEFEDHPREIFLDAAQTAEVDQMVKKTYRLPALSRLK